MGMLGALVAIPGDIIEINGQYWVLGEPVEDDGLMDIFQDVEGVCKAIGIEDSDI